MRKIITALLFITASAQLWAGAAIEGVVELPKSTSAPPPNGGRYVLKASKAIADPDPVQAVVYLEGNFPNAEKKSLTVPLSQKNFQFLPGILPIQTGTRVEFPNHDDDYHNVFSYSKIKRFDLGRYRKEEKPPAQLFDKPGVVKLYCEIHEHMRGTILVLDTPHFTKTDAAGKFRLENLPEGRYTLKAWIDEKTILEKPVELKTGEVLKVNFTTK